jgi:hypothetical protein
MCVDLVGDRKNVYMHALYMVQQYLLLALAALAIVICLTFAFSDDKEDTYAGSEMESSDESDFVKSKKIKRRSARDISPIRIRQHAEASIPASTL